MANNTYFIVDETNQKITNVFIAGGDAITASFVQNLPANHSVLPASNYANVGQGNYFSTASQTVQPTPGWYNNDVNVSGSGTHSFEIYFDQNITSINGLEIISVEGDQNNSNGYALNNISINNNTTASYDIVISNDEKDERDVVLNIGWDSATTSNGFTHDYNKQIELTTTYNSSHLI